MIIDIHSKLWTKEAIEPFNNGEKSIFGLEHLLDLHDSLQCTNRNAELS